MFLLWTPLSLAALCGNTTTGCSSATACCQAEYSPTTFGCMLGKTCCKPGPALAPSTTLPNCLVIGDSVSIGYTGTVTKELESECLVQHGPYDVADGGAGATSYAVECLDNWLVTQSQQRVTWDVIAFNFGLHNLDRRQPLHRANLNPIRAHPHRLLPCPISQHNSRDSLPCAADEYHSAAGRAQHDSPLHHHHALHARRLNRQPGRR